MTTNHALEIYNKANGSSITQEELYKEESCYIDLAAVRAIQEVWGYAVNLQRDPHGINSTQILALVIWQAKEKARQEEKLQKQKLEEINAKNDR